MSLTFDRHFTKDGVHPYDEVNWVKATAEIGDVFKQEDVQFPEFWSQTAINIVSQKYFFGKVGEEDREYSLQQLIDRVVNKIVEWGKEQGYFDTGKDALVFSEELTYVLLHQMVAFNSPVWFNLGNPHSQPQVSACFINGLDDTMESISELERTQRQIFRAGSGAGTNNSRLRSSREYISGGGKASGPNSFMQVRDTGARVTKSGGKTRRAAMMDILEADHGDIFDFCSQKSEEERKAYALMAAGYTYEEAYDTVAFQNSNLSARVSNAFMEAVEKDEEWALLARKKFREVTPIYSPEGSVKRLAQGTAYNKGDHWTIRTSNGWYEVLDFVKARDLSKHIANEAWQTGDPGMQYHDTINMWHTCPESGEIRASNPCSEYMFVDDTSCNLASLNLVKFYDDKKGMFNTFNYQYAIMLTLVAQDIVVSPAHYPAEIIKQETIKYRALGLGYANLGALLMKKGFAYDSEAARNYAGAITALMQASSYHTSALMGLKLGAFPEWEKNKEAMAHVIKMHEGALLDLQVKKTDVDTGDIISLTKTIFNNITDGAPFRNAQVTVLAPTGTISFMMDCATTGIEPMLFLKSVKKLAGGGELIIVPECIEDGLRSLGYVDDIKLVVEYMNTHNTCVGAPHLKKEDYPLFATAAGNDNTISVDGHLKMMAATQPFLSGAISKTVNLPNSATVEDIEEVYMKAWKLGLKAVALYRDGCKAAQPMNAGNKEDDDKPELSKMTAEDFLPSGLPKPKRVKMNDDADAKRHKFNVGGQEGYLLIGLYDDGSIGEIWIEISKEGSTFSGLLDSWAIMFSVAIQYGVPLESLIEKFKGTKFEPAGFTTNTQIRSATSIIDYICRYLENKYLNKPEEKEQEVNENEAIKVMAETINLDGPPCTECDGLTYRKGSCYVCNDCGATTGCG